MPGLRLTALAALTAACLFSAGCYQSNVNLSESPDADDVRDHGGDRDDAEVDADARPDISPDDAAGPDDAGSIDDVGGPDDDASSPDTPPDIPADAAEVPFPYEPMVYGPLTVEDRVAISLDEQPAILASAAGDGFVALTRVPEPSGAAVVLRFHRLALDGTEPGAPVLALSSLIGLGPHHPLLELPDGGFLAAFLSPAGPPMGGVWLTVLHSSGEGEYPQQVPETDANSIEPAIALDDTGGMMLWNQYDAGGGWPHEDELRAQGFDRSTGETTGTWRAVAEGEFSKASIQWADGCYLAVFADEDLGTLRVARFDADPAHGTMVRSWSAEGGGYVFGAPALAWNGRSVGVLFEVTEWPHASLMLAEVRCDDEPIAAHEVPLDDLPSPDDPGEMALAWAADRNEWGIAWTSLDDTGFHVKLVVIDADDDRVLHGPFPLYPTAEYDAHPALAYGAGFYGLLWTDHTAALLVTTRVATYGCGP
jgi:hypothetical protein